MIDRLEQMEQRYDEIAAQMGQPKSSTTTKNIRRPAARSAKFKMPSTKYRELKQVRQGLADARAMLAESDADMRAMAEEEIAALAPRNRHSKKRSRCCCCPKIPTTRRT